MNEPFNEVNKDAVKAIASALKNSSTGERRQITPAQAEQEDAEYARLVIMSLSLPDFKVFLDKVNASMSALNIDLQTKRDLARIKADVDLYVQGENLSDALVQDATKSRVDALKADLFKTIEKWYKL